MFLWQTELEQLKETEIDGWQKQALPLHHILDVPRSIFSTAPQCVFDQIHHTTSGMMDLIRRSSIDRLDFIS